METLANIRIAGAALVLALMQACVAQDSSRIDVSDEHVAVEVDPAVEARAREQASKPLAEQPPEVQAQFAKAKELARAEVSAALAEAIGEVRAQLEARTTAGAAEDELAGLREQLALLQSRADR